MNPTEEAYSKAVISNRIFMAYTPDLYDKCKNSLTYKIPARVPGDPPEVRSTLKKIGERALSIPVGRLELIPKDYVIVDKRIYKEVEFPKFKFKLRESQQEIYDLVQDNCLINANTSWGKTFTGIAIASKLSQKTLVIVHTTNLRRQWEEEVKKTLGIEPGVIGGGHFYHDSPITIANIQTLRKHSKALSEEFGTVIVDEVHHVPSKTFEECLNDFKARYKIGLSATLQRKDFLHILLPDYFGHTVHTPKKENQMKPRVWMYKSLIPFSSNPMIPWARKVNELVRRDDYLELVTSLAERAVLEGHKVLVVSDRTDFLEKCYEKHEDVSVMITGKIAKDSEREARHKALRESEYINILYGAISIYKEGISENCLSCLILAAPTNNEPLLEQLIGRVLRIQEGKKQPLIIDIVLSGNTAKNQSMTRVRHYTKMGYEIKLIEELKNSS
jgi:superfamily II DNA or RNA helicase